MLVKKPRVLVNDSASSAARRGRAGAEVDAVEQVQPVASRKPRSWEGLGVTEYGVADRVTARPLESAERVDGSGGGGLYGAGFQQPTSEVLPPCEARR